LKGDSYGKIWLEPNIEFVYLKGFNNNEINKIQELVLDHSEIFKKKWHEHFNK